MKATKLVFALAFAACALQCNAAEISKSADKVDLRLFVENGAAIAKNIFKNVNAGLDQSKPNMDKILNELAPEAKTLIRKIIDKARTLLNKEETRVNQIFTSLTTALDNLKPIKPCSDKVSPAAKKLALATEKEAVKTLLAVREKNSKEIQNVKIGVEKILQKARTLFDTKVVTVVKCLTPGRKDASACLNKELNEIVNGVKGIAIDGVMVLQTAEEVFSVVSSEVLEKMIPLVKKVMVEGRVLLKLLGDCVATLK